MDNSLIMRGENFAAGNKVYLLMAMAVFDSGKIVPATNFLENKTVFIGPDGKLLNVFHKITRFRLLNTVHPATDCPRHQYALRKNFA